MTIDKKLEDILFVISLVSTITAVIATGITAYFKIKKQVAMRTRKQ